MFIYLRKVLGAFANFLGKKRFILYIFLITLISLSGILEPVFMAMTISFIENFYHTGIFETQNFLIFLGIWAIFIVFTVSLNYIHRYYLSDKPALEFHNFIAKKYSKNLYYMTMGEYLSKKTGSIFKNFDRGTGAHFVSIFIFFKDVIGTATSIIAVLILLIIVSWKMTITALIMVPFMGIVAFYVNKKTYEPQNENEKNGQRHLVLLVIFSEICSLEKFYF